MARLLTVTRLYGVEPTSITYRGVTYRRDPDGKQRSHRVYYGARDHGYLHRRIYEDNHGPIPDGWHVHHADENPFNNDPANLVALPPDEHSHVHPGDVDRTSPEWLEHLASIRLLAAEWHSSPEGIEWHREHGKQTWEGRERQPVGNCAMCGEPVTSYFVSRGELRFCSRKCIGKYNETTLRYHTMVPCPICGTEFPQRRRRPKTCSPDCAKQMRKLTLQRHG